MPLAVGERAPDFRLRAIDNTYWILGAPDSRRSVLVVFFRRESKACRVLLPFVERLHRRLRKQDAEILGISLDGHRDALEFAEDYTLTFPMLLDPPDFETARRYRVEQVPLIYRLDADLRIVESGVGWSKSQFETLAAQYLEAVGAGPAGIWEPGDIVPEFVDSFPVSFAEPGGAPRGSSS